MSPNDHSDLIRIAIGFAISITCIAIFLRLLARRVQKLPLGADDYFILVGAIFTIGNAVVFIFAIKYGSGRHITTLQPAELVSFWKTMYAGYQIYGVAVTLIKMSILLFYRRIFATKQFRQRTNIVGALVIVWLIVNNLTSAFQCRPVRKAWDIEIPGHCFSPISYITGVHTTNLVLDIVILALPVSAVCRLQMSLAKKISVIGIFLLGGLSVIIAIVRLVVVVRTPLDSTWYTSIYSWTAVEPAIEVLSVSLPVMAPFLHIRAVFADLRTSLRSFFSLSRSQKSGNDGTFHEIDKAHKAFASKESQLTSTAVATSEAPGSEPIPMNSIVVTDRLEWN